MNNPFDRHKDPVNHDIFERFFSHIDIVKKRKEWVHEVTEEIKKEINSHIEKMTPDLLVNYVDVYKQLTFMIREFEKTIKVIERKTKKLFESSTLTEDVYKIKDEVKNLKKKIDKFNSGIRALSRLTEGDVSEEE